MLLDQQVISADLVVRDSKFDGATALHCRSLMYIYDSSGK